MTTTLPLWFEITSLVVLSLIILFDLILAFRRPHIPSVKESTAWVSFYVTLALVFGVIMYFVSGVEYAGQFIAGWLTEYSLSIDNLFVFIIIMARFKVPRMYQQELLMVGILLALLFRGVFILLGAQIIENFSWVFYIFGAWLLFTAYNQAFTNHDDAERKENAIIRWLRTRVAITDEFHGAKIRTEPSADGGRAFTPVLLVLIALGTTDVVFALDSIPAIFGITQSAFIVFAANIFALMGLRQLYFLLGDLLDKLVYLHYGIAFILAFIGVKLVFHALHENEVPFINGGHPVEWVPVISTWLSLIVIVAAMIVSTAASLMAIRRRDSEAADTTR